MTPPIPYPLPTLIWSLTGEINIGETAASELSFDNPTVPGSIIMPDLSITTAGRYEVVITASAAADSLYATYTLNLELIDGLLSALEFLPSIGTEVLNKRVPRNILIPALKMKPVAPHPLPSIIQTLSGLATGTVGDLTFGGVTSSPLKLISPVALQVPDLSSVPCGEYSF